MILGLRAVRRHRGRVGVSAIGGTALRIEGDAGISDLDGVGTVRNVASRLEVYLDAATDRLIGTTSGCVTVSGPVCHVAIVTVRKVASSQRDVVRRGRRGRWSPRQRSRSIVTNYARSITVDDYLDAAPEPQRSTLRQLRAMLASIVPDAEEAMSYGVPAFKVAGKAVAGYAHAKRHCSYFPHSGSVIAEVEPELLEGYDWGKGTLRFPVDEVPKEVLVRRLVEIRLGMLGAEPLS